MAGAGYNLFTTGSVLTAAQVNTFLQEQTVMRFANATARTTALSGVLAEGMMSYLDDTNTVEVYNGSAWVSVGSTGDITAVTTAANSGLTGGATSGDVALRINTTAKGSIVAGSGASTLAELTVGTNGHVLTADSTTATGLKWASATAAFSGCLAVSRAAQTISNTTFTAINLATEIYDTDNIHSTTTNNTRFTIPTGKGGYWLFYATAGFDQTFTGAMQVKFYKNGSATLRSLFTGAGSGQNGMTSGSITEIINVAAGDYVELFMYQNSGSNKGILVSGVEDFTFMGCQYLGA